MPLIVTFSEVLIELEWELLQVLASSTTLTSIYFSLRLVPEVNGKVTRPELSVWSETEEPGGNLNENPNLLFW